MFYVSYDFYILYLRSGSVYDFTMNTALWMWFTICKYFVCLHVLFWISFFVQISIIFVASFILYFWSVFMPLSDNTTHHTPHSVFCLHACWLCVLAVGWTYCYLLYKRFPFPAIEIFTLNAIKLDFRSKEEQEAKRRKKTDDDA